nr:MAG TPA: hypothetical protein [Caudoviricetes sp.]
MALEMYYAALRKPLYGGFSRHLQTSNLNVSRPLGVKSYFSASLFIVFY